jgi:putative ABC transport system ATP-binding protein
MFTPEERAMAIRALDRFDLAETALQRADTLSGGQQQRVAIARSLVNNPAIILADEPTGNLDSKAGAEVMGIFQTLNEEKGITIILVTHEPDIAEHTRRIVHIYDGKIVKDEQVLAQRHAGDSVYSADHRVRPEC